MITLLTGMKEVFFTPEEYRDLGIAEGTVFGPKDGFTGQRIVEIGEHGTFFTSVICYNGAMAAKRFRFTHLMIDPSFGPKEEIVAELNTLLSPIRFYITYPHERNPATWISMHIPLKKGVTAEERSIALTLMRFLTHEFTWCFDNTSIEGLGEAYRSLSTIEDLLRANFRYALKNYSGQLYTYIGHYPFSGYLPTYGRFNERLLRAEVIASGVYNAIRNKSWERSGRLWGARFFSTGLTETVVYREANQELAAIRAQSELWPR